MKYTKAQLEKFIKTRSAWLHRRTLELVVVGTYSHTDEVNRRRAGISFEDETAFYARETYGSSYDMFYERGWIHIHFEEGNSEYAFWLSLGDQPSVGKDRKVMRVVKHLAELSDSDCIHIDSHTGEDRETIKLKALV